MTPAATIKTRLSGLSAVTTLVGTRIYVDLLPQKVTLPAIRLQRISERAMGHLRGASAMRLARVQVDALATTLESATAIADAAHGDDAGSGLSGFTGNVSGQAVFAILPVDVRSDYEGEELTPLWRVSRDYLVWLR